MRIDHVEYDWVKKWADYKPDGLAFTDIDLNISITYRDLNTKANGLAISFLNNYGLKAGDRIAAIGEFSLEYITLFVACQKSGIILIPLNYRLSSFEINEIIIDCDPKLLFINEGNEKFSNLKVPLVLNFSFITNVVPNQNFESEEINESSPIFILYTSGTTGKPKGAIYTHKMLFWNSINTALSLHFNSESATVNVMPSFHTGGWNVLLTPFLHHGGHIAFVKNFKPDDVILALEKFQCNIFMAVPTMLSLIANSKKFQVADFSFLDYIIVGGEPMPIPLIKTYAEKGVAIRQGYGMTEVGPNLTSLHQDFAMTKIGSIGKPNFYVETKIIKEDGSLARPNEQGELWLSGPMVTPGYWRNEYETKKAFSEDQSWFKTGDIVTIDSKGFLYIVDRLKNMFISGAENVYPAEIERILRQLPEIEECAVIGVKDQKWGEVGHAFIVFKSSKSLALEDLKAFCLEKLAKFKIPKYFDFINEIPKTDSGKIDRKKLKENSILNYNNF